MASELHHLLFTPCGIQILSGLGQSQSSGDYWINWRTPFSKQKPGDMSMNFIKSPPLSAKVVKLLQTLWAGSPQTQQVRRIYSRLLEIAQIKEHCQLNSGWRWTVRLFSEAEQPAPAFGSAAISWPNTVFWKQPLLCWSARYHPRQTAVSELQHFSEGENTPS